MILLASAVAVGATVPTGATAAAVRLAHEAAPTPVAALDRVVTWSRALDGRCGEHRCQRYALVARVHGHIRRLPVPIRAVPFDVDLGRGPDGRLLAVYSRCRREPVLVTGTGLPVYASGGGCRLFRYSFATRKERPLDGVSRVGVSEVLPAIAGTRVAFAARPSLHSARGQGAQADVVSSKIDGTDRVVLHRASRSAGAGKAIPVAGVGPVGIDMDGSRVAVAWQVLVKRCGSFVADAYGLPAVVELRLLQPGRDRVIDRRCTPGAGRYFASPALVGGSLSYYAQFDPPAAGRPDVGIRRYDLRSGRTSDRALVPGAPVVSAALTGAAAYLVTATKFSNTDDAARRRDVDISRVDL
jgi:hypothetical protein